MTYNRSKNKKIKGSLVLVTFVFFALLISCSQKYDETGIFDPQDPNFSADTLKTISVKNTIVNSISQIQDDYLYLGADISGADTSAYSEILLNFELFNTDSTLDSAYILIPVLSDSISSTSILKPFDILKVKSPWDITDVNRSQLDLIYHSTNNFYSITDTSSTDNYIRIDLEKDSLMAWYTDDSLNYNFNGFYIRSVPGNEISPILKLYSSRWDYASLLPKVHRFRTDTVFAYDGITDSTFIAETTYNFSEDISFVKKGSACLDTITSQFKIGGISGEGIVCKIDTDSIPSDATVITGRFEIDHDSSPALIDPVYGDIRNNLSGVNEINIYKVTNSDWITDMSLLEYDSVNVWTYKIAPVDTTTYMVADAIMQEWITDPADNHGFYITSANWGHPFGFMIFDNLTIKVSYITIEDQE